jgi:hypothetical protein
MHQVGGANPSVLTILSLWCSPANMPASHAGDHRSEAGQGRRSSSARGSRRIADPPDSESGSPAPRDASRLAPTNFKALKAFPVMRSLGRRANSVQFRVGAPFRSRASAQTSFISSSCPGQHRRLRPFSPPCSSLRIVFVKRFCRSITGWRIQCTRSRSPIAETRRRERRQCGCKSRREHQPSFVELRLGEPFSGS